MAGRKNIRLKIKRNNLLQNGHKLRKIIQYGFLITCLWLGIQFYFWYRFYANGGNGFEIPRPAGAEGFLPLSGLIGLKYWLLTGIVNHVHPAALVILLAAVVMSLIFKKSFCSFVCPVGLISEWHWKLGRKLFGRKAVAPYGWKPPQWLDYPLRSLKYILLGFFVYAILISMNTQALQDFIDSPYNKVADIKMLLFFVNITTFAFGTILLLMVASLFISNFWCRYLCPYGGLLGLISFLSPVKIRRVSSTCTDCLACTRICPAMITVHKAGRVNSDECTGCLECVRVCPVDNTLYPEIGIIRKKISPRSYVLAVMGIFLIFYLGARLTGHWNNNVSRQEYIYHVRHIDEYTHLR